MIRLKKADKYNAKGIKRLYKEAFPQNERVPLPFLKYKARKRSADFFAIYDDEGFAGLLYCVYHTDIIFLFYLAIRPEKRGRGYGSLVLEKVKKRFKDQRVILSIEEVTKDSENYEQRRRRRDFYMRNGFETAGFKTKEYGVNYEFMQYGGKVRKKEYLGLLKRYMGRILFRFYRKMMD